MAVEFDAALREKRGQPLTFQLGGRTWHTRPKVPFGLIGELAAKVGEGGLPMFSAFADLVVQAVARSEREEFREMLYATPEEDDDVIDLQDVAAVARQIAEQVTGSPFGSASASPASPSSNGGSSLAPVDSGATTSLPHRHVRL